jgi:hypothetical protein
VESGRRPAHDGSMTQPSEQITAEVASWPGIETIQSGSHITFRLGRREIGHLHGDHAAHFGFPKDVWRTLYAQGRIVHHPVFPDQEGWAARGIRDEDDVRDVIALLRMNYDRVVAKHGVPA